MMPGFKAFALYQCEQHISISGLAAQAKNPFELQQVAQGTATPAEAMISARPDGSSGIIEVFKFIMHSAPSQH